MCVCVGLERQGRAAVSHTSNPLDWSINTEHSTHGTQHSANLINDEATHRHTHTHAYNHQMHTQVCTQTHTHTHVLTPGVWCRRSRLQLGKRVTMACATDTLANNIISSTMLLVSCVCVCVVGQGRMGGRGREGGRAVTQDTRRHHTTLLLKLFEGGG